MWRTVGAVPFNSQVVFKAQAEQEASDAAALAEKGGSSARNKTEAIAAAVAARAKRAQRVKRGAVDGDVTARGTCDESRIENIHSVAVTISCANASASGSMQVAAQSAPPPNQHNITNNLKETTPNINQAKSQTAGFETSTTQIKITYLRLPRLRIWPILDSAVTSLQKNLEPR